MPLLDTRQVNPQMVGTVAFRFRDDFPGNSLNPNDWAVSLGTGMSISVSNSSVTISSGTTPNAVTTLYLKKYFRFPSRVLVAHRFNVQPANITGEVEIVSVNPDTGEPDDMNEAGVRYLSGYNTLSTYFTKNEGSTENTVGVTTSNYVSATSGVEIVADFDSVEFASLTSTGGRASAHWNPSDRIPEPGKLYTLRIRLTNASTAPTNQTWTFPWVAVMDYEEMQAELVGGRLTSSTQTPTVFVSNMLSSNTTVYEDTGTALGAGATFNGTARDTGGSSGTAIQVTIARAVAHCFNAAPGTLYIDQSRDGTTWVPTASKALAGADTPNTPLECAIFFRYWRVRYVNGATAQTTFWINSGSSRI